MSTAEAALPAPPPRPARPGWWIWLRRLIIIAPIIGAVILLWNIGDRLISGEAVGWESYFIIAALVFGDAVIPILPGETTLNAGSVLASNGKLELWLVMLAGSIGAVTGDSTVYWLARKAKGRTRKWMDKTADSQQMARATAMLQRQGAILLLFGRYIPGVRFALNAALGGVVKMPYRKFLMWSALSGTLWSIVTCLGAYTVSSALAGYPLLSLILSCTISAVLISAIIWVHNKWTLRKEEREAAARDDVEHPDGAAEANRLTR
jgi:membrane protein DedA with SNARE-associated domain